MKISSLIPWKRVGLFVASLVFFVAVIILRGPALLTSQFLEIGNVFFKVLALYGLILILQTMTWKILLQSSSVSFFRLLKLKIGGEGMNSLSSLIPLRGDLLTYAVLRKLSVQRGTEILIIDRGIRELPLFLFLRLGIFRISPAAKGGWEETERLLFDFYRNNKERFFAVLLLHLLAFLLLAVELCWMGGTLLNDFSYSLSLLLTGSALLVTRLFFFLPGSFGVLEILFAAILGFGFGGLGCAVGITLSIARRLRALFWIVVGLILQGNPFKMFLR